MLPTSSRCDGQPVGEAVGQVEERRQEQQPQGCPQHDAGVRLGRGNGRRGMLKGRQDHAQTRSRERDGEDAPLVDALVELARSRPPPPAGPSRLACAGASPRPGRRDARSGCGRSFRAADARAGWCRQAGAGLHRRGQPAERARDQGVVGKEFVEARRRWRGPAPARAAASISASKASAWWNETLVGRSRSAISLRPSATLMSE